MPYNTHCELLYCLCNDLPVFDEICKRSLRFIAACLSHHCDLVRFFAWHGIVFAPCTSLIGRNIIACSARYSSKICDALAGCVDFHDAVKRCCCRSIRDATYRPIGNVNNQFTYCSVEGADVIDAPEVAVIVPAVLLVSGKDVDGWVTIYQ